MKVLKNQGQVLQIINRKLNELRKKFDEAEDELEEAEIYGQRTSIISVKNYIRCTIEDHGCFEEEDLAHVCDYADGAEEKCREFHNLRDALFMKGLAKGAAWARVEIEDRMMEPIMKVLKDPDDLFRAMNRKEREYQRDIDDASDVARAKAVGRAMAVLRISILVGSITLDRDFTEADMESPREYADRAERVAERYDDRENVEAWLARGRVEGAAWALQEIERRMR